MRPCKWEALTTIPGDRNLLRHCLLQRDKLKTSSERLARVKYNEIQRRLPQ